MINWFWMELVSTKDSSGYEGNIIQEKNWMKSDKLITTSNSTLEQSLKAYLIKSSSKWNKSLKIYEEKRGGKWAQKERCDNLIKSPQLLLLHFLSSKFSSAFNHTDYKHWKENKYSHQ